MRKDARGKRAAAGWWYVSGVMKLWAFEVRVAAQVARAMLPLGALDGTVDQVDAGQRLSWQMAHSPWWSALCCDGLRASTLAALSAVPHCLPLTLTLSPTFGPVRVPRPLQETRVSGVTATVTVVPTAPFASLFPLVTVAENDEAETDASVPLNSKR